MSYCPNCGSKFESGKFRCPNCGSLLVYEPRRSGPSFWFRVKDYKNIFILIALAVLIATVRAALVVTNYVFLLLIVVIAAMALMLWLRNKRPRKPHIPYQQNRFQQNNPGGTRSRSAQQSGTKAKVIPFRKRKEDPRTRAKED